MEQPLELLPFSFTTSSRLVTQTLFPEPTAVPPQFPTREWELRLARLGYLAVAGVDEAGRGPLAGPVVAAAVVLPAVCDIEGVRDSKVMTAEARQEAAIAIRACAISWAVAEASPEEIDDLNIVGATHLAMWRAVRALAPRADALLVDGLRLPDLPLPARFLVKGDAISLSIAAASVLAKVARDATMVDLDRQYPAWGFARHKGYGTREHLRALMDHGPCPCHRRTFSPVSRLLDLGGPSTTAEDEYPVDNLQSAQE